MISLSSTSSVKKKYAIKEIFYSLQGEGAHSGRPAIFIRFAGCNLWSGREEDRKNAVCSFCDTDFLGGGEYSAHKIRREIYQRWPGRGPPFTILTGGEPLLQVDEGLIKSLNVDLAIETNGTLPMPSGPIWTCVSPKAGTRIRVKSANEVKVVFPQKNLSPELVHHYIEADHYWLQPMDGPELKKNTNAAVRFCLKNPPWKLSLQVQKLIGIK